MMSFEKPRHIRGLKVILKQDEYVDKALRRFKKKVAESRLLQNLKEREFYEKPTTAKKRALSAAKNRWKKKLEEQSLPKKMF
jgi:small subunit ribosomal protein S21